MRSWPITAVTLCCLLASACDSGTGTLVPVRGTVNYKGSPLRHGTIVFAPDSNRGGYGPLAQADIQPDGSYALNSEHQAGACVGWHRVTIVAVETAPSPNPQVRYSVPRSILPEKYSDPALSGLACEVKPGKDNTINFNLE